MMRARRRMCGPSSSSTSSLKREFVKKWIKGLQICRKTTKEWSILERINAIKLSADVAIASTRNAATHWRRALLRDVVSRNKFLGHRPAENAAAACSRRILRRSRIPCRRRVVPKSSSIARKLVALRKLVPGGEEMDGVSLLQETLDYIVSLRVQVDVMRRLAAMA